MTGAGRCYGLLTQRQAEAQSPCKVHGACGPPEARQLRVGQRLGQLEDARHVLAVVGQRRKAVLEAVSEGGEQLSASKADSDSRGRSQVRPMFECCLL